MATFTPSAECLHDDMHEVEDDEDGGTVHRCDLCGECWHEDD